MKPKDINKLNVNVEPPEPKELSEHNRGVFISGLNQSVTVIRGYYGDDLNKLSEHAVKLFRRVMQIEREER